MLCPPPNGIDDTSLQLLHVAWRTVASSPFQSSLGINAASQAPAGEHLMGWPVCHVDGRCRLRQFLKKHIAVAGGGYRLPKGPETGAGIFADTLWEAVGKNVDGSSRSSGGHPETMDQLSASVRFLLQAAEALTNV